MPPSPPFGFGRKPGTRPPFRRRARPRNEAPETVAALLPTVVARLGGDDRAAEQRISLVWADAVGALLAKNTRIEGVRGRVLLVRVSSSSYAHELVLLRREILTRIARELGVQLVDDLRSRVGAID